MKLGTVVNKLVCMLKSMLAKNIEIHICGVESHNLTKPMPQSFALSIQQN